VSANTRNEPSLWRDPDNGVVAGICAGLGQRFGIDPVLLRIGLVVVVIATAGVALVGYGLAWLALPVRGRQQARRESPVLPRLGRGGWRVGAGAGLLTLSALLVFRELGLWWSDALVWPLVLAISGAALLWRQSRAMAPDPTATAAAEAGRAPELARSEQRRRAGPADLYRGGFGIALVVGAALLFLSTNDALGTTREVVLATLAGVMALALILAPFLWRLGRNLASERAERIRSQERAELAAHLHDSVLQTLTLMQKRAGNAREVAALARRQERELRSWLFDGAERRDGASLAAALEAAGAEVEDAHGVAIEVVSVGDRRIDPQGEALIAATREALTNAAKFAGDAGAIAVYAEMDRERAQVFVRDRGEGFEPAAVPADRRGLRESIIGRMARNGGSATVRSSPGEGTEVELVIEMENA
jgi:signal transduction histidine kinase